MGPSLRLEVAEAPGAEEAEQGEPLVGGSGKIMNMLWRKAGVQRDALTIINTINCRPPDNIYPTDGAARKYCSQQEAEETVSHCYRAHVKPLLDSRPWERIDALGEKALRVLTGKTDGIMKWRGSPLPLKGEQKPRVMPILHPAYIMRDADYLPTTISDLMKGLDTPPEFYELQPTIDQLKEFENAKQLCFDIETNIQTGAITMVGVQTTPYHVAVAPFRGGYIEALKRIFATAQEVIGQNILQFDIPVLEKHGIKFREDVQVWDIMLMFHLIHPDAPAKALEYISSIYTQKPAWKHLQGENMALYCARDVDVTLQSFLQLKPLIKRLDLLDLYNYTQVPLAKICHQMHETGISTNPDRLKYVTEKLNKEILELENILPQELRPYEKTIRVRKPAPVGTLGKSGKPVKFIHVPGTEHIIPWNSPKIIEKYLYETLGLPKQLHPKTKKVTTDKNALDKLFRKTKNPVVKALKDLRAKDELRTTFFQDKVAGVGRVHTNFLVHGTNSGRLSSSGPNLQNLNGAAKYIYVPSHADWCFVEADFSSLENRLTAWYANDWERLKRLAIPGYNEHKESTSKIFGIPVEEITKEMPEYRLGKAANHAANYGLGPRKFAMTYDISEKEARKILLAWREANPLTVDWQERTAAIAARDGVLTTAFGRKRWFWSQRTYTESLSFLPQSSGADISFRAMIALMYQRINWPSYKAAMVADILSPLPEPAILVAQVHDSLLVECPYHLREEVVEAMRKAMAQPWKELGGFSIPVEFKIGEPNESWAELHAIK